MKTNKIIAEIICFLLVINFFYEGLHNLVHYGAYNFWLKHIPYLEKISKFASYALPFGELILSVLLIIPLSRIYALYFSLAVLICFIGYLFLSLLYSPIFFLPFHAFWDTKYATWFQKMIYSLTLAWLAFMAILLFKLNISVKKYLSKILRNTSADVN
jgi:hypothetical protein